MDEIIDAAWFARRLPAPGPLAELLGGDPVASMLRLSRTRAPVVLGFGEQDAGLDPAVEAQLRLARAAAAKLAGNVAASLSEAEVEAMHAFVHLVARPSLRVVADMIAGIPETWPELTRDQALIMRRIRGVGRLDTATRSACGTGWVVARDRLLTNKHVAAALCGISVHYSRRWEQDLAIMLPEMNARWARDPEQRPIWDPHDSPGLASSPAGRIVRIVATHPTLDMALLEIEGVAASEELALTIALDPPASIDAESIYVPGYPQVSASLGLHPALLAVLFGGPSELVHKRVAPGHLCKSPDGRLVHDASTLGGSSGSPLISFATHEVVGLHFSGAYAKENRFVALWELRDDDFFGQNGVELG